MMYEKIKPFTKEQFLEELSGLKIEKVGENVVTTFNDRTTCIEKVSERYQIFDFGGWLSTKIDSIIKNFSPTQYSVRIYGGIQQINLYSETIEVSNEKYQKSLFILSSSNRTRALSMYAGIKCLSTSNFYILNAQNFSVYKKHLKGMNEFVDSEVVIDGETFQEQVEAISKLVGSKIYYSKLFKLIVNSEKKVDLGKFEALRKKIEYGVRYHSYRNFKVTGTTLTKEQLNLLNMESEVLATRIDTITPNEDFMMDAYEIFKLYMSGFNKSDSQVIKKETERIMKMTQGVIRNDAIDYLLSLEEHE